MWRGPSLSKAKPGPSWPIEARPPGSSLSYFARYQGGMIDLSDVDEDFVEHIAHVGLRLNLGAPTLQERDAAAGLVDFNPLYGANPARHF